MFSATWVTRRWKTSENTFCFSSTICSEYNYCAICKWKVAGEENLNNFAEESNSQIFLLEEKQEIINLYQRRMRKVTTCGIFIPSSPFHCLSQLPNRATYIVVSQEKNWEGDTMRGKNFHLLRHHLMLKQLINAEDHIRWNKDQKRRWTLKPDFNIESRSK